MTPIEPRRPGERPALRNASGLVAAVVVALASVLAACGIDFGEASDETEILKDISFEGPFIPGDPITMILSYAQQYPTEVRVRCDLLTAEDVPTATPAPAATLSPSGATSEPTLPHIPLRRPTPTNKLFEIYGTTLQPYDEGGPIGEATPVLDTIERRFFAPPPGNYVVWCYTPADLNNSLFQDLTIPE